MVGFSKGLGCGCCGVDGGGRSYCTTPLVDIYGVDGYYGHHDYPRLEEFNAGVTTVPYPPWRALGDATKMLQAYNHGHTRLSIGGFGVMRAPFVATYPNVFEMRTRQELIFVNPLNPGLGVFKFYQSRISGLRVYPGQPNGSSSVETGLDRYIHTGCIAGQDGLRIRASVNSTSTAGELYYEPKFGTNILGWDLTVDHYVRMLCTQTEITYFAEVTWTGSRLSANSLNASRYTRQKMAGRVSYTNVQPERCEVLIAGIEVFNYDPAWPYMPHNDSLGTYELFNASGSLGMFDGSLSRIDYHRQTKS